MSSNSEQRCGTSGKGSIPESSIKTMRTSLWQLAPTTSATSARGSSVQQAGWTWSRSVSLRPTGSGPITALMGALEEGVQDVFFPDDTHWQGKASRSGSSRP
jgi:hypothetical protein